MTIHLVVFHVSGNTPSRKHQPKSLETGSLMAVQAFRRMPAVMPSAPGAMFGLIPHIAALIISLSGDDPVVRGPCNASSLRYGVFNMSPAVSLQSAVGEPSVFDSVHAIGLARLPFLAHLKALPQGCGLRSSAKHLQAASLCFLISFKNSFRRLLYFGRSDVRSPSCLSRTSVLRMLDSSGDHYIFFGSPPPSNFRLGMALSADFINARSMF